MGPHISSSAISLAVCLGQKTWKAHLPQAQMFVKLKVGEPDTSQKTCAVALEKEARMLGLWTVWNDIFLKAIDRSNDIGGDFYGDFESDRSHREGEGEGEGRGEDGRGMTSLAIVHWFTSLTVINPEVRDTDRQTDTPAQSCIGLPLLPPSEVGGA